MMMSETVHSDEILNEEAVHPLVEAIRTLPLHDFLEQPRLLQQLQNCCSSLCEQLISQPDLQRQLFDCILRPTSELSPNLPYRSTELFVGLGQPYMCYLLDQLKYNLDNTPLLYMFCVLETNQPVNQTCAGYLFKLVSNVLCSEHGSRMITILQDRPHVLDNIIRHIYNPSVGELFLMMMTTEKSDSNEEDWVEVRGRAMDRLVAVVGKEVLPQEERVQGVADVVRELVQKGRDGARVAALLEGIITVDTVRIVSQRIQNNIKDQGVVAEALGLYEAMLEYYKVVEPSKMFVMYGQPEAPPPVIPPAVLESLTKTLKELFPKIVYNIPTTISPSLMALSSVISFFCSLFPSQVKELIDFSMFRWAINQIPLHPNNNILHNNLLIIIQMYVQKTDLQTLRQQHTLFQFINNQFLKDTCYRQHLFNLITHLLLQQQSRPDLTPCLPLYQQMKDAQSQPFGQQKPSTNSVLHDVMSEQEQPVIHFDPGSLSSLFQNQKFDLDIMTDDVNVKVLESPVVGRFTFDPDMPFDDNMLTAAEGGGEIQQIVDSLDEMFTIEVIPAVNDKEKVEEMPKLTIEDLQPQIGQVQIGIQTDPQDIDIEQPKNTQKQDDPLSNIEIARFIKDKFMGVCGSVWQKLRRR